MKNINKKNKCKYVNTFVVPYDDSMEIYFKLFDAII